MHTSAALLSDVYSALSNWAIAQKSHECAKYLFHAEKQWTFAKMSYLHRYLTRRGNYEIMWFQKHICL